MPQNFIACDRQQELLPASLRESIEWYGPSGPVKAIASVLGVDMEDAQDKTQDELPSGRDPSLPPPPEPS
jgi:hypothetical protein